MLSSLGRRTDIFGLQNKGTGERQSAVAALNYGAGAGFISIPSPRCTLSGGIKEDTQSGFSLGPHRQSTQRTALTAAERDSGGRGDGGARDESGMVRMRETYGRGEKRGGHRKTDEGRVV